MDGNFNINDFLTTNEDPEELFQTLEVLGQGTYGTVYKALHIKTGKIVAAKIVGIIDKDQLESLKKEVKILRECQSSYIVQYYGSYYKDRKIWIIIENCDAGSVLDLIKITKKNLTEEHIASIIFMVLKGLEFLHGKKMIHRDIKAGNVLLSYDGNVKLADFGVSAQLIHSYSVRNEKMGSPYWMSPEVINRNDYSFSTDIWSLGITCIELAEGEPPFSTLRMIKVMQMIITNPTKGLTNPSKWSKEFNDFVKVCLNVDPLKRPIAKELQKHPFLVKKNKGVALISELVTSSLEAINQYRNTISEPSEDETDNFNGGSVIINPDSSRIDNETGTVNIINNENFTPLTMLINSGENISNNEENGNNSTNRKDNNKNNGGSKFESTIKESRPKFMDLIDEVGLSYDDNENYYEINSEKKITTTSTKIKSPKAEKQISEKSYSKVVTKEYNIQNLSNNKHTNIKELKKNSKKILIRFPDENSILENDDMTIGDELEIENSFLQYNEIDNNQHNNNNKFNINFFIDKLPTKRNSKTPQKINTKNNVNFNINELVEDHEVNNLTKEELDLQLKNISDEMEEEILKIRLKYQQKFDKFLFSSDFLKRNNYLKKLKEYDVYAKFSKFMNIPKKEEEASKEVTSTSYGELKSGNSTYTREDIKIDNYHTNNISNLGRINKMNKLSAMKR